MAEPPTFDFPLTSIVPQQPGSFPCSESPTSSISCRITSPRRGSAPFASGSLSSVNLDLPGKAPEEHRGYPSLEPEIFRRLKL